MSKDLYSKEIEVEQEAIANGDLEVAQNVQLKQDIYFQINLNYSSFKIWI